MDARAAAAQHAPNGIKFSLNVQGTFAAIDSMGLHAKDETDRKEP